MHDGKIKDFKMTVIKSFQHDPLGRQCAESLRIKSIEPSKRINNRKEYHQPGDVEVRYEKNESEETKLIRKRINERRNKKQMNDNDAIDIVEDIVEKANEAVAVNKETNVKDKETHKESEKGTTVEEFIKKMRKQNEESINDNEDDITSTQNMIEAARERKSSKNVKKCEQCEFNTASSAMLRVHVRTKHREGKVENKTPTATKVNILE